MKQIELTKGQVAIVDDEDFDVLNQFNWYAEWNPGIRSYYAERNVTNGGTKVRMHRAITGAQNGFRVDHVNRNTLDNRRENLRLCSGRNRGAEIERVALQRDNAREELAAIRTKEKK